jgi:squalene synthase HpnC
MVVTAPGEVARGRALRQAYRWCGAYARKHDENFTVISWVLPASLRPHFAALYAYCRYTDDLGDEAEGDRLALLDAWRRDLLRCYEGLRETPLFIALGHTIDRYEIPSEVFDRLIEANRMDQVKTRFATYSELLHYCEYSATPVGRMVLYVLGYRDGARQELSDATCIALQLANFWQDVARDREKGRIYLPLEDMARFGVTEEEIAARRDSKSMRRLIRFEVQRARELFARGRELEGMVDRRARADVRLFRLGGEATLDAIRARKYDVLTERPTIPKRKKAWMAASAGVRMKLGF